MKIKLTTWHSMLARYGDYEARRRLRYLQKARGCWRAPKVDHLLGCMRVEN